MGIGFIKASVDDIPHTSRIDTNNNNDEADGKLDDTFLIQNYFSYNDSILKLSYSNIWTSNIDWGTSLLLYSKD